MGNGFDCYSFWGFVKLEIVSVQNLPMGRMVNLDLNLTVNAAECKNIRSAQCVFGLLYSGWCVELNCLKSFSMFYEDRSKKRLTIH